MSDSGSIFDALHHSIQNSQSDTFDSASEISEQSSSCDRSKSRGRPRKRKTTEISTSTQPSLKRLKSSYNDDYRGLFNSTVKEIASNKSSETDNLLKESQIGVTLWSPDDKEAFFRALARRGRQDIRGIAADIGSKSDSEVYVYSDMLYKAAVDQQIHESRKNMLDTSRLEAALDVHGDCCAALDLAAEALSALEQNEVERVEKNRHGDLAVLTPRIARWLEGWVQAPEGDNEELSEQIPAASLLNLMNFLALSKQFFMNSVIAEDNWRSYTGRKTRSPSIMYTAFSDFHALSISITQRLVQASLFFAMSRLRAMSASGHYTPRSHVRRRDVTAALNVLDMKTDAKVFWARTARKCNLRVYDKVRHRKVFGKRYSYAEVEKILSSSIISDTDSPELTAEDTSTSRFQKGRTLTDFSASASESSTSSNSMSIVADESSALSNDEDYSVTPLDPTKKQDHNEEGHDQLRDTYAEVLDLQASRNEEHRLWGILGEDPAMKMEPVDVKLPKALFPPRKDKEELVDWKDWVDYAGEWETHGTPVFGSSFANHQGLKKDLHSAAGLTSSEDEFIEEEHDSDSEEDADHDGTTSVDGAHISSGDDAEQGAGSSNGSPDRNLQPSSLEDDNKAIIDRRSDLRPSKDDTRHNSRARSVDATDNDIESSDDDSPNG
ncbi:hypothetical protein IMSHALPRED_010680 [Imshaugia aleurites]|uniref:Uncharacterized protein n=1 Tax=Imshaugia aleurites TaxID=172621 RepID=A0A8H3I947_9LECA|nr:hypothetical protein IMSHALPRED_010680 [Imshaugia aleurites]